MKSIKMIFTFSVVFTLVIISGRLYANETEPEQIESSELKQTIITPHMEEAITSGRNLIYCSTFQIAWNMLQDEIIKDEILLKGRPPMATLLNKQLSTKNDISEESYVAMVDELTEEFLERINDALEEKFGNKAPPEVEEDIIPDVPQIFSYAYLYKNLQFAKEFERLKEPIEFRSDKGTTKVKAFGIKKYSYGKEHRDLGRQVSVIDYKSDDDFIISLKSKSADDEIILAKIESKETLLSTILAVSERVKQSTLSSLKEDEVLHIPKLDFNLKHSFSELEDKLFENKGWEGWFISKAMQWIRFKLNEKGAILKSEARIDIRWGSNWIESSRRFIFDKPFLIYLKQKDGKYPYFAMWVDNVELLVK